MCSVTIGRPMVGFWRLAAPKEVGFRHCGNGLLSQLLRPIHVNVLATPKSIVTRYFKLLG